MTRGKEAAIVLKSCQAFDGDDTVSHWISEPDIRLVYNSRQAGEGNNTYERVQAHAKSVGVNVDLHYEYPCKLFVTVILKP